MYLLPSVLVTLQCIGLALGARSHYLHLTAVVSDENYGHAKFECWQMATPFGGYPTVGESISGLADVTNVSYVVLPPKSGEGIHKPPHPMLFVLLSGLAHVTLPISGDELYIVEGVNGLIVAADTQGVGHITDYPSDKPTIALQIPFKDGRAPEHQVVSNGVCAPGSVQWERDGHRTDMKLQTLLE